MTPTGYWTSSPARLPGRQGRYREVWSVSTIIGRWLGASILVMLLLALTAPSSSAAPTVESATTATPGTFTFVAREFEGDEEVSTWITGPRQQVQASGN